ncbi:MAG: dehydrogenase [Deltaproteobacteria bacterium]|nr:MAG: dehydrogenase [Deltaproteobacteria bacterium]
MKEKARKKVIKSSVVEKKLKLAKKYGLNKQKLISFWKNIYLSRKLDDAEISMRKSATAFFQISGAGHEGVLTAFGNVLWPTYDYFIPYYRDRALCLALGMTPYEMLCQANGNIGDIASHGRQMPVHFGHKDLNIISVSSCTGTQFLQGVGLAETGEYLKGIKDKKHLPPFNEDEITYVSSGDGTTSQGEFWEAVTTACVNNLPVMFMIEDNGYAISVPVETQTPGGSISKALEHFPGLKIFKCDGNCPIDSYAAAVESTNYLRKERGPVLIHAKVTRPYSHSLSDDHSSYRTKDELSQEAEEDVINNYPKLLIQGGVLKEAENEKLKKEIDQEVREAREKAENTPWPEPETCMDHLFSEEVDITSDDFKTDPEFSGKDDVPMAQMINLVLKNELKRNPLMIMFGEDVADFGTLEKLDDETLKGKGGVFAVTRGCQRVARPGQVFNSPLAEANIIGRAIGMATRGLKPVVEIQFFDYIWTAFMQLKNEMATMRYRSGGDFKCPMVVRVPIGGYLRGGSIFHSQCGESIFSNIPGIYVAFPSNAQDAAGLLRTAIRADDPVLFLEHKHLYYQGYNRSADPGDNYMIPFGEARVVREGNDATIVAWGALVQKSIDAAKKIEKETGKTIEIIDPRTLVPFDIDAVKKSLSKTNRLLICHEDTKTSGFAGEIAALVNEECFESLDAPILRVAAKDTHVAYCPGLEDEILPQVEDVKVMLTKLLDY